MPRHSAVIIGAGHSGLAMSRALDSRGIDHLVLERGQVGNSWRTERWDSLRLLTPNWMNGLPGLPYAGDAPDGYMTVPELVGNFETCAAANGTPLRTSTEVLSVTRGIGYRVQTDQGMLICDSLVVATGACSLPDIPDFAGELPTHVEQISPINYRRFADLGPGGVLVVGASASGLQIARELALAGRRVILAVGNHLRLPRLYRGADILTWMCRTGVFDTPYDEVDDIERVRRTPSLPLMGSEKRETLDLNTLQDLGVEIVGRFAAISEGRALFSGSLANLCASADLKMNRLLEAIDHWIDGRGLQAPGAERFAPTSIPDSPRLSLDLNGTGTGIGTVVWATGYRPDHRWLQLPVFDRRGPEGFRFDDLVARCRARLDELDIAEEPEDVPALRSSLATLFDHLALELRVHAPTLRTVAGARPTASALSRWEARHGTVLTTALHTGVPLEPIDRAIVEELDGTKTAEEIARAVAEAAASGALALEGAPHGIERMTAFSRERVDQLLTLLGWWGLVG